MKILITCLVFLIIGIFFINYNQIIADPKYIIAFLSFPAIIASAIVTYYVAFCPSSLKKIRWGEFEALA